MDKLLRVVCAMVVAYSFFTLVGGKNTEWGRRFLHRETGPYGGDLFNKSLIDHFRGRIDQRDYFEPDSPRDADVVVIGDSFATTALDSEIFATELEKASGLKVSDASSPESLANVRGFAAKTMRAGQTLVYVVSERNSLSGRDDAADLAVVVAGASGEGAFRSFRRWKDLFSNHDSLTYFYTHNAVAYPVYKALKNLRFQMSGQIDDANIGLYSIDPPMLFYNKEVNFNRRERSPVEIEAMVERAVVLSRELARSDIRLIYAIVPNKLSLYGGFVGETYDGFLPTLVSRLRQNGVEALDLYPVLASHHRFVSLEPLYYSSDTHWTPAGKALLVRECVRLLAAHPSR